MNAPYRISGPLSEATLIRRYKRFLADVRLGDGSELTVHCPNSGSMATCAEAGRPVRLSDSANPKRKLRFTLEMIHMGEAWVGVNTINPNRAVAHFTKLGAIPELVGYDRMRPEVKYGHDGRSRIDLLLEGDGRSACYVEVKNTTMRVDATAAFPDAVTTRGQKHLVELMEVVRSGCRAVMFYFIGRADCTRFGPADGIDPEYGRLLRRALEAGVEVLPYRVEFTPDGLIHLKERVGLDLG